MGMLEDIKKESERISKEIAQDRDELKLKAHLFSMDAKDEWENLEKKFEHFKGNASQIKEVADESVDDLSTALKIVHEELKAGYKRIKESL